MQGWRKFAPPDDEPDVWIAAPPAIWIAQEERRRDGSVARIVMGGQEWNDWVASLPIS